LDEQTGVSRESPRTACDGCGRTNFNGEYVELWVATGDARRVFWSGCVDCWESRTAEDLLVRQRVAAQDRTLSDRREGSRPHRGG